MEPNAPRRHLLTAVAVTLCLVAVPPLSHDGGVATRARGGFADPAPASAGGADGGGRLLGGDAAWIRGPATRGTPAAGSGVVAPAAAGSGSRPEPAPRPAPVPEVVGPPSRLAPEGWLVAGGRSPVAGTEGRTVRYTVEVADDLHRRIDLDGFAAAVTGTLADPDHGWTTDGTVRLQRVDDPGDASVRVLLADPARVDELCARAGLDTEGRYSCWNGEFAALNADRWFQGVAHVDDLALYRSYLVNHEVGHGLGHGHERCPQVGALAPLMLQLSVSDEGCVPNGVPFP